MKRHYLIPALVVVLLAGMAIYLPLLSTAEESQSGWLKSADVGKGTIKAILDKEKDWEAEKTELGLKLVDENGRTIHVLFDQDKELICFVMYYGFKPNVTLKQKKNLANEINDGVVFTKAMVDSDGDLRFEYWLRYSAGLSEAQVLDSIKYFVKSSAGGVEWKDTEDLVK